MTVKKRTKSSEIIRVGDQVEIVNPEFFVRCGYPLTVQDELNEVHETYNKRISQFLTDLEFYDSDPERFRLHHAIDTALALVSLRRKNHGGSNRSIFTETKPDAKNLVAFVRKVRWVKTGIRVPGHRYQGYEGDSEYDPPYLSHETTHKILTLGNNFTLNGLEIEAKNVKKVIVSES